MASLSRRFEFPRSLVGRSLLASVSALLLVMALLGGGMALVFAFRTEPFSWEGPGRQEAHVRQAMRFDAGGRLVSIALPASAADGFDALPKDMAYQLVDASGAELLASPPGPALDALRRLPPGLVPGTSRVHEGAQTLLVTMMPVDQGGVRYVLRDARSERLLQASGPRAA